MDLLFYFPQLGWLVPVQLAFTIWMLVDASRRRVEVFWYWIILILQPIGAWAYFFVYKLQDFKFGKGLGGLFQGRTSLAELRFRAQQTPTLANQLALGERLVEAKDYAEATPHLEAVVKREPEHCHALFALATCHARLGKPDQATPALERLIAKDRWWNNYAAWKLLVESRMAVDDKAGALEACRELVRLSPTLEHRCLLAEHLLAHGQGDEARGLLQQALDEHQFSAGPIRRRNRRWAAEARRLQKQIPTRV